MLSGCGGSESGSPDANTADITQNNFLPYSINEQYLTLQVESGVIPEKTVGFPTINTSFNHFIGAGDVVYLQSDNDNSWQYRGRFSYQEQGENIVNLQVTLPQNGQSPQIEYTVTLTFTDNNTGDWQANVTDDVSLSGSFNLAPIMTAEKYQFKGTLDNNHEISSQITHHTYAYHVYLPENYFTSDVDYPVIFSTDGQWKYLNFSYAIETSAKDIIYVAIEEGEKGRRDTDYTLAGSENYLHFLADEMLPLIASEYRIDNTDLALEGHSYGGLLVRHALSFYADSQLFKNFISIDGSYFTEPARYMEIEDMAFANNDLSANLYLSSAKEVNEAFVTQYKEILEAREMKDLKIFFQSFNVGHIEAVRPSIKDALIKLYP